MIKFVVSSFYLFMMRKKDPAPKAHGLGTFGKCGRGGANTDYPSPSSVIIIGVRFIFGMPLTQHGFF